MVTPDPNFSQDEVFRWNTETSLTLCNIMQHFVTQTFPPECSYRVEDLAPLNGTLAVLLVRGKFVFSMSARPATDDIVVTAIIVLREGASFIELGSTVAETPAIAAECLTGFYIKGKTMHGLSMPILRYPSVN